MSRRTSRRFVVGSAKTTSTSSPHLCSHRGEAVRVGEYTVFAGGAQYLKPSDFDGVDLLVPLTHMAGPLQFGKRYEVLAGTLPDFGGVHTYWEEFLDVVIDELKGGKKILAFCVASHGRTGTFLASLIALLESAEETPDPIAAVRKRHCSRAVETLAQAEAIFDLRKQAVPEQYRLEFAGSVVHATDPSKQPQPKV